MDSSHHVTLPRELIVRCEQHGAGIVHGYGIGLNANSRAVTTHGADRNPRLQATAKMAECAFCLWAGLDPIRSLHWGDDCDPGFDAMFGDLRVDVKETAITSAFLIWPVGKRALFAKKPFDVLVLVKSLIPHFVVRGWVTKQYFAEEHGVADDRHVLTPGTWHMHEKILWPMYELELGPPTRDACHRDPWGRFANVSRETHTTGRCEMNGVSLTDIVLVLYVVVTAQLAVLSIFGFVIVVLVRRVRRIERYLPEDLQ